MRLNYHPHIGGGSHLSILMKLVNMTEGPILELGMGLFSTPYLHWACYDNKRTLVSCENKKDFHDMFIFNDHREANNDYTYHKMIFVEDSDWDKIDLVDRHWSIVLVDHNPGPRRKEEIRRLANSADYILVHDSDDLNKHHRHYKFPEIYPLFKYRYDNNIYPRTTVLSNFKDLSDL